MNTFASRELQKLKSDLLSNNPALPEAVSDRVVLSQVVTDFFDELKSRSRGYASMEYKLIGYRRSDLVRLDIKINSEVCIPALLQTCQGFTNPATYQ